MTQQPAHTPGSGAAAPVADDEQRGIVRDIVKDARFAMLATLDATGAIVSRPMTVQEVEFDGDLWFFADASSAQVSQIRSGTPVNVAFTTSSSWLSVAGPARVVEDRDKARELWNTVVEAWFPDGPDSPAVVLLKVEAATAEYWASPGGRISTLLSLVRAKVTGERDEGGTNETVAL
ncbi:pyridoxamine 5'-phosphate oxidase family protein [Luteimicrobium subarcticum]|uniref:General stress protein 26 n=1 Tax=Luteimicrobium subarcticum TaxID=620910 RepID=A0A2M8W3F6_9MICO|nr:pyridoxamine 5'-phosphate oxidase family protein [Luteimicrobium subarcticum]PJI85461.1 general stress protein 26 [Luteimicrobium subarcticum]